MDTVSTLATLAQSLDVAKGLCKDTFGHSLVEVVAAKDGVNLFVTRRAPPSRATLEQSLDTMKALYEDKSGHSGDDDVVAYESIKFIVTPGHLHLTLRLLRA